MTGENGPHRSTDAIRPFNRANAARSRSCGTSASAAAVGFQPQRCGDFVADGAGQVGAEVRSRHAMRNCPCEQVPRQWHDHECCDRTGPGGFAEHCDRSGIAAECADLLLHPTQRRNLVEEAPVGRGTTEFGESVHADTMVGRDHDDPRPGEYGTVITGIGRGPEPIATAVDPHHHRQTGRTWVGRPDVERQPIVGVMASRDGGRRRRRPRRHLRRWGSENIRFTDPVPGIGGPGSLEP